MPDNMQEMWRDRAMKAEAALEDARDITAEIARQRLYAETGLRNVLTMLDQIIGLTIQKNAKFALAVNVVREYVTKALAGRPEE